MTTSLPYSLAPFLQEYDLAQLDPQTAAPRWAAKAWHTYRNLVS